MRPVDNYGVDDMPVIYGQSWSWTWAFIIVGAFIALLLYYLAADRYMQNWRDNGGRH